MGPHVCGACSRFPQTSYQPAYASNGVRSHGVHAGVSATTSPTMSRTSLVDSPEVAEAQARTARSKVAVLVAPWRAATGTADCVRRPGAVLLFYEEQHGVSDPTDGVVTLEPRRAKLTDFAACEHPPGGGGRPHHRAVVAGAGTNRKVTKMEATATAAARWLAKERRRAAAAVAAAAEQAAAAATAEAAACAGSTMIPAGTLKTSEGFLMPCILYVKSNMQGSKLQWASAHKNV